MPDQPHDPAATPAHLPALLPPTNTLLHRTQTTLGLLRDVVQESSAEYWYERGKEASAAEAWAEAAYAFGQCIRTEATHWRGALQHGAALCSQGFKAEVASALLLSYNGPYPSWDGFVRELSKRQWIELHITFSENTEVEENDFETLLAFAVVLRARDENIQARQVLQDLEFHHEDKVRKSALWYRLSGTLWHEQKELSKAGSDYSAAIILDGEDFKSYFNHGMLNADIHDYDGALADFNRAIELDPSNARTYKERGTVKLKLEKDAECLSDFDHAITLDPKEAAYFFVRGIVKQFLGDSNGALADYNRTIELDSMNAQAYVNRGLNKGYSGDYLGALTDFECAFALDPNNAEIFNHRGRVKHSLEDYEGALSDFNYAITLNPGYVQAYTNRAHTKKSLGDEVGARVDYLMTAELMVDETLRNADKKD